MPTMDPLQVNDMLKLATIYLNAETEYVYVCYHCDSSFRTINDTLNHVESHYDAKVIHKQLSIGDTVGISVFDTIEQMKADQSIDNEHALSDGIKLEAFEIDFIAQTIKSEVEANEDDIEPHCPDNGDTTVECRLCEQQFTPSTLLVHLVENHVKTTKFKCPVCPKSYVYKPKFLNHLFIEHIENNDTTYVAVIDQIISTCDNTVAAMKRPFTKYQTRFLKTCEICSEQFSNIKNIRRHMRRVHVKTLLFNRKNREDRKSNVLDCNKCHLQFFKKFDFYAHQYGHLTCDDADMDLIVLRQQLLQFLDDNIFKDESSPGKPIFQCKLCSQEPAQGRKSVECHILQRHIYYMRPNRSSDKLTCDQCNKTFANTSNLDAHKKALHATSTIHCMVCNRSFKHKRYLKSHMEVHSEMRRHQCSECGKTFKKLLLMRKHSRTHSEETVQCTICNKEVKTYRLQHHIKHVHESEHRPYTCPVCSLTFKTRQTLTNHSYRHTGERKFSCRYNSQLGCTERFVSSAARRAHERSKHEGR